MMVLGVLFCIIVGADLVIFSNFPCVKSRREVIGLLSGLGLDAIAAGFFKKLHGIPAIEEGFMSEVDYWAGMKKA
jgi:hypothetical protein